MGGGGAKALHAVASAPQVGLQGHPLTSARLARPSRSTTKSTCERRRIGILADFSKGCEKVSSEHKFIHITHIHLMFIRICLKVNKFIHLLQIVEKSCRKVHECSQFRVERTLSVL